MLKDINTHRPIWTGFDELKQGLVMGAPRHKLTRPADALQQVRRDIHGGQKIRTVFQT